LKWVEASFKNKSMNKNLSYLVLLSMVPILSGCSVIETIFKAGMWWAFILIFLVVGLILWIFFRARKK